MKNKLSNLYQSVFKNTHHLLVCTVREGLVLTGGLNNEQCQFNHQFMDPEADLTASSHSSFEIFSITADGTVRGEYFSGDFCSHDIHDMQAGELISILKVIEEVLEEKETLKN